MPSMPASRSARAMIFAPRSWPSSPGLATTTRIFRVCVLFTAAADVMAPAAAGAAGAQPFLLVPPVVPPDSSPYEDGLSPRNDDHEARLHEARVGSVLAARPSSQPTQLQLARLHDARSGSVVPRLDHDARLHEALV